MNTASVKGAHKDPGPLAKAMIDFGPLLIYLAAYWVAKSLLHLDIVHAAITATGVFMVATVGAIVSSKLLHGKVSAMLWFSSAMVLVLGGLTIFFKDPSFIQMKPTIYYLMVTAILVFGLYTDRPTLKLVFGQAYPGLTDAGWAKLTRNWAFFFAAMAIANEAVWRTTSFEFWQGYKLWGALPATILFAIANMPMLMKHGFNAEGPADVPLPPQG